MTACEVIKRKIKDYKQKIMILDKEIKRDKERVISELNNKYDSSIVVNLANLSNRTAIDITRKATLEECISDLEIMLSVVAKSSIE